VNILLNEDIVQDAGGVRSGVRNECAGNRKDSRRRDSVIEE
jgi:hypothetical protein